MPGRAARWGRPVGSARSRLVVWIGTGLILLGLVLAAVVIVWPGQPVWLWAPVGVLLVVGVVLFFVGKPSSTSRVPDRDA